MDSGSDFKKAVSCYTIEFGGKSEIKNRILNDVIDDVIAIAYELEGELN